MIRKLIHRLSMPEDPIRLVIGRWVIFILYGVHIVDTRTGKERVYLEVEP